MGVAWKLPPVQTPQLSPLVWAWRTPKDQTPQAPPWVWAWKAARHAGIHTHPRRSIARQAWIPPAMHAGIPLPPL